MAKTGEDPFLHAIRSGRSQARSTTSVQQPELVPSARHPETVSRYGRSLSTFARLYCGYFSLGLLDAEGVTYGRIFPRRTCIHAMTLTDNEPTRAALDALYGTLPGPGIRALPPCVRQASLAEFESRLARRAGRTRAVAKRHSSETFAALLQDVVA